MKSLTRFRCSQVKVIWYMYFHTQGTSLCISICKSNSNSLFPSSTQHIMFLLPKNYLSLFWHQKKEHFPWGSATLHLSLSPTHELNLPHLQCYKCYSKFHKDSQIWLPMAANFIALWVWELFGIRKIWNGKRFHEDQPLCISVASSWVESFSPSMLQMLFKIS